MLTQIAKVAPVASAVADKQIVVQANGTSAVMYEVPSGRKFSGYFLLRSDWQVIVNDVTILYFSGSGTPLSAAVPIVLVAGAKVKSGQSYVNWSLIGVETNA